MMNPYEPADRRIGRLTRQIAAEFQNLRVSIPFDHLHIAAIRRSARAMYTRMDKRNRAMYLAVAAAVYAALTREEAEKLVDGVLRGYNSTTGYVYTREIARKCERLVESIGAAQTRTAMQEAIARAGRLWTAQAKQYADEVVDAAMLASYRDAGVQRVRWVSQEDERRCGYCLALDGREFPIDDIPARPHPKCRCYTVPVE